MELFSLGETNKKGDDKNTENEYCQKISQAFLFVFM